MLRDALDAAQRRCMIFEVVQASDLDCDEGVVGTPISRRACCRLPIASGVNLSRSAPL
jgi:hypothetical protein